MGWRAALTQSPGDPGPPGVASQSTVGHLLCSRRAGAWRGMSGGLLSWGWGQRSPLPLTFLQGGQGGGEGAEGVRQCAFLLQGTLPPREPASEVRLAGLPGTRMWSAQSRNVLLAPATARPPAAGVPAGHTATATGSPRNRWPWSGAGGLARRPHRGEPHP